MHRVREFLVKDMTKDQDKRAGIVVDPEDELAHLPPAVTRQASFNDSPTIRGAPPIESGASGRTNFPAYRFPTHSADAHPMPPTRSPSPPTGKEANDEVFITMSEEQCDIHTRRRYIPSCARLR